MPQLSIEQQFAIASFNTLADRMSREQAIDFLKKLNEAYFVQKAQFTELLKHQWGIADEPHK